MARWIRKDTRVYEHSTCKLCGSAYGVGANDKGKHRQATCLACGTVQCDGCLNHSCGVCLVGLLSRTDLVCGYKNCGRQAIARAPRVQYVCLRHAKTCQQYKTFDKRVLMVWDVIQEALSTRDKHWILVDD